MLPDVFLSTLSLRRATVAKRTTDTRPPFLSTLSLRRATKYPVILGSAEVISIHALLAESDRLKTPCVKLSIISIHALLAESDVDVIKSSYYILSNFYPRSPCGERRSCTAEADIALIDFYPRSPCGERHDATLHCLRVMRISIHALLAESDTSL